MLPLWQSDGYRDSLTSRCHLTLGVLPSHIAMPRLSSFCKMGTRRPFLETHGVWSFMVGSGPLTSMWGSWGVNWVSMAVALGSRTSLFV